MVSKGTTNQDTTRPAEVGKQGNEPEDQKGKTPQGTPPQEDKKATTPAPSATGKEGSGEVVPKTQYTQLQKAYESLRADNESLRTKLTNLDLSPLAQAMANLKAGLETRAMEDQMWRIGQLAESGDAESANRLAERELNRQLAELGMKPETAPPQVMNGDAVQRLHNLLLVKPFLAQGGQPPQTPAQAVANQTEPPAQTAETIGGKTLEDLENDFMKKHGLLNITKQAPGGIADELAGCNDPEALLKAAVRQKYEED